VRVYHCHSGLLEGIVPLYDRHKTYLGAIVFGQLRDKEKKYPAYPAKAARLLRQSRLMTKKEVCDIGKLLKQIGENIIENEIIKRRNKPWTELIEDYIQEHLDEKLTLAKAAKQISRSSSFISQNFPKEFGMPFKSYILKMKMERAMKMLENGSSVKQAAAETGFYDEFHFSKKFKKYFGKPPSFFKVF
jgi:YesN/AraC family two-component response regulator